MTDEASILWSQANLFGFARPDRGITEHVVLAGLFLYVGRDIPSYFYPFAPFVSLNNFLLFHLRLSVSSGD